MNRPACTGLRFGTPTRQLAMTEGTDMSSDIGEAGGPTSQQGDAAWAARGSAQSPDRTSAEQGAVVAAAAGSNASSSENAGQAEQDLTAVASQAGTDQAGSEDSAAPEPAPRVQPIAGDPGTSYDRGDLAVHDAFVGDGRYSEGDAAGDGLSDAPSGVPHEAT
jgi:hypothetical protein